MSFNDYMCIIDFIQSFGSKKCKIRLKGYVSRRWKKHFKENYPTDTNLMCLIFLYHVHRRAILDTELLRRVRIRNKQNFGYYDNNSHYDVLMVESFIPSILP